MQSEEFDEVDNDRRDGEPPDDVSEAEELRPPSRWEVFFRQALYLFFIVGPIGLVVSFVFDGLESQTYFYEVDKAVAQGRDLVGQSVRIKGIVEPGSIEGDEGELERTFDVAGKGRSLTVHYEKALPDTFKPGVDVVVEGTVDDHYVLQADEVMVKCPSRYEGSPPTAHEGESPQAAR